MNNSDIIKTLDIRKENMKSWEISDQFVTEESSKLDGHEFKYPYLVGILQATLSNIMIELKVYHPDVCKFITEKVFKQEV